MLGLMLGPSKRCAVPVPSRARILGEIHISSRDWVGDWVWWSRRGLGWGMNLGKGRDQVGTGTLAREWPETGSGQDQGMSLEEGLSLEQSSEEAGAEPGSWPGLGRT